MDAAGRRAFSNRRGRIGTTPPRFPGPEQEPPGSGSEQTSLGQGGGFASADGEAYGLSLAHPSDSAQIVGHASRVAAAGQYVLSLQRLKSSKQWAGRRVAEEDSPRH